MVNYFYKWTDIDNTQENNYDEINQNEQINSDNNEEQQLENNLLDDLLSNNDNNQQDIRSNDEEHDNKSNQNNENIPNEEENIEDYSDVKDLEVESFKQSIFEKNIWYNDEKDIQPGDDNFEYKNYTNLNNNLCYDLDKGN